jgi:hypothetical protein
MRDSIGWARKDKNMSRLLNNRDLLLDKSYHPD